MPPDTELQLRQRLNVATILHFLLYGNDIGVGFLTFPVLFFFSPFICINFLAVLGVDLRA
jgi:hypothetical protein